MANVGHAYTVRVHGQAHERTTSSVRFDWIATALNGALVGGVYLDAWAHEHGRVDTTFFTPWHGVMYGAMVIVMVFLLLTLAGNLLRGADWRQALPVGYGLSLFGTGIFAIGGIGDMIWHTLFGVEANLEALISPSHIVLALGWFLIVGGPLRAAWHRTSDDLHWMTQVPRFLSIAFILSVLTFFTIYANPFGHTLAAVGEHARHGEAAQALGVTGFLVQPALMMGVLLLALGRWRLPRGSVTLVLAVNTALVAVLHDQYLLMLVGFLGGMLAELIDAAVRPSPARPGALRIWAAVVPMLVYALYFGALQLTSGIAWSVHMGVGAIVLAGVVGLLLSYLAVPPTTPVVRTDEG